MRNWPLFLTILFCSCGGESAKQSSDEDVQVKVCDCIPLFDEWMERAQMINAQGEEFDVAMQKAAQQMGPEYASCDSLADALGPRKHSSYVRKCK